jgi:hypothetical protein
LHAQLRADPARFGKVRLEAHAYPPGKPSGQRYGEELSYAPNCARKRLASLGAAKCDGERITCGVDRCFEITWLDPLAIEPDTVLDRAIRYDTGKPRR